MKNIIFIFLSLFINNALGQVNTKCENKNFFNTEIKRLEKQIDSDISSVGSWQELINIPDMLFLTITLDKPLIYIFRHPGQFQKELINYIESPSTKWEYKYYALGLLQGQCIDKYVSVIPFIYKLVRTELLQNKNASIATMRNNYPYIDLLYLSISQENLSNEVRLNFKNPLLKKHLQLIKNDKLIPAEIRNYCTDILSGEIAKSIGFNGRKSLFKCKKDRLEK